MPLSTPSDILRVIIADDHALFAESLARVLEALPEPQIRVSSLSSNGEELMVALRQEPVDLVLLDLNMPVMDGLEVLPVLRADFPSLPVMVVTQYRDPKIVRECLQEHGVNGYALKSTPLEQFIDGIRQVMQGTTFISNDLQLYPRESQEEDRKSQAFDEPFVSRYSLTRREMEILELIAQAKSNADIAAALFISRQTVLAHRKNIMRKLNITSTPALVRFAIQHQSGG